MIMLRSLFKSKEVIFFRNLRRISGFKADKSVANVMIVFLVKICNTC